jgi:hypothetical protein
MTFAFVAKHRHIWPVSWMCEVLGVSRSGFHAWLRRPISARASYDAKLVVEIDKSFKASDRTYGARRVWRDVLEGGLACGLHRIKRLMRQNAMRARPKRRRKPKDDDERSVIADNILDRDFEADRPNQRECPELCVSGPVHEVSDTQALKRSPNGQPATSTAPTTQHAPTCSITSSASTIRDDATRSWATLAPWRSRNALCEPNPVSTEPAAGQPAITLSGPP